MSSALETLKALADGSKSVSRLLKELNAKGFDVSLAEVKALVNENQIPVGWKNPNHQIDGREALTDKEFVKLMARRWKFWVKHRPNMVSMLVYWLCGDDRGANSICRTKRGFLGFMYGLDSFCGFAEDTSIQAQNSDEEWEVVKPDLVRKFCEANWKKPATWWRFRDACSGRLALQSVTVAEPPAGLAAPQQDNGR